jgi:hypothetical protein
MKYLILFLTIFISQTTRAQVAVYDPVNFATRVLEYTEQVIAVKVQWEELTAIKGVAELYDFITLEEFDDIRKHAPEQFLDLLSSASNLDGGTTAVNDLLEALSSYDIDDRFSRNEALQALYEYKREQMTTTTSYAANDYDTSAQYIEMLNQELKKAAEYQDPKQREAALIRINGEELKSNYRIMQSLSQLIAISSRQEMDDLNKQKRYMEMTSDRSGYDFEASE